MIPNVWITSQCLNANDFKFIKMLIMIISINAKCMNIDAKCNDAKCIISNDSKCCNKIRCDGAPIGSISAFNSWTNKCEWCC